MPTSDFEDQYSFSHKNKTLNLMPITNLSKPSIAVTLLAGAGENQREPLRNLDLYYAQ